MPKRTTGATAPACCRPPARHWLTQEGYRYGKFQLLDVLDAQRTVVELEADQAAALQELLAALVGIEALLNLELAPLMSADVEAGPAASQPPPEAPVAGVIEEHHHD